MASPLLLSGQVDSRDREIETLRRQLAQVDEALRLERNKAGAIEHALRELQRLTEPFRKLLNAIHGEIDDLSLSGHEQAPTNGAWKKWKQKLGGKKAEVIEALQSHPMTRDQIRVATRSGWSTVDESVKYLKDVGLIEKLNGKYQLKEL